MAVKCDQIEWLENLFKQQEEGHKKKGWLAPAYRILESPHWYSISVEDSDGEQIAFYQTGSWSEIVDFCGSHCNQGNELINGLGCTNERLIEATEDYVHSLGKLTPSESYLKEHDPEAYEQFCMK